jgi:BirA family biotin operon repressor/biotin-[acetyl-CoA-carboxylase] ligase
MHLGTSLTHLTSVDSTNNYAAKLIKEGVVSSGAVIMADVQTAGKGQRGSIWDAKPGENLLLSVVLRHVNMSVNEQFVLNQLTALAIKDLLGKFGISSSVKWPNDVFVGEEKIAGILIESSISGSLIKDVIIGIGLNVNQTEFSGMRATSMLNQLKENFAVRAVLDELLIHLNYWWSKLVDNGKDEIHQAYLNHLLGFKQWRTFLAGNRSIEGRIDGVDEWGRLMLTSNDQKYVFDLKEITYCW